MFFQLGDLVSAFRWSIASLQAGKLAHSIFRGGTMAVWRPAWGVEVTIIQQQETLEVVHLETEKFVWRKIIGFVWFVSTPSQLSPWTAHWTVRHHESVRFPVPRGRGPSFHPGGSCAKEGLSKTKSNSAPLFLNKNRHSNEVPNSREDTSQ